MLSGGGRPRGQTVKEPWLGLPHPSKPLQTPILRGWAQRTSCILCMLSREKKARSNLQFETRRNVKYGVLAKTMIRENWQRSVRVSHGPTATQGLPGSLSDPPRAGRKAAFVLLWNFPDYPLGGTQVQLSKQCQHRRGPSCPSPPPPGICESFVAGALTPHPVPAPTPPAGEVTGEAAESQRGPFRC